MRRIIKASMEDRSSMERFQFSLRCAVWSMGAWYEYSDSYGNHEKLDGLHVEFHKGPMYYGCANEEWYAELVGGPENVEYTVTVIDNNDLELYRYVKDSAMVWFVSCERSDGRWIEE